MTYHILNGDALAFSFRDSKIAGEIIVVREGFIDGDLFGDNLEALWQTRAKYTGVTQIEYYNKTVKEFDKIMSASENAEFNLWFEYDLFCQVNMWFVISIIHSLSIKKKVFVVYTSHLNQTDQQFWNGFGRANATELNICFANKMMLTDADLQFAQELWNAYKNDNLEELSRLSKNHSTSFPYLQEVVQAHIDRFPKNGEKGRPEKVLEDITKNVSTNFNTVFKEFWNRESIYGFGDVQLKHLYDKVMRDQ